MGHTDVSSYVWVVQDLYQRWRRKGAAQLNPFIGIKDIINIVFNLHTPNASEAHHLRGKWPSLSSGSEGSQRPPRWRREALSGLQPTRPVPSPFLPVPGARRAYMLTGSFCVLFLVAIPVLWNSSFSLMYSCLHSS